MTDKHDQLVLLRERVQELETELAQQREVQEILKEQNQELAMLLRVANLFLSERSEKPLDSLLDAICEELESPLGSVEQVDSRHGGPPTLLPVRQFGAWSNEETKLQPPPNIWAEKAKVLRRTVVQESDCEVPQGCIAVQRVLSVPLVVEGEVMGTLSVANRAEPYGDTARELLESVAIFTAPILASRDKAKARFSARVEEQKNWAETRIARSTALALEKTLEEIEEVLSQPSEEAREELQRAREQTRHGLDIVRKLGVFGHQGLGAPQPFDLNRVVSNVIDKMLRADALQTDIVFEGSGDLGRVLGDLSGLEQVVKELLRNALDANKSEQLIKVETSVASLDSEDGLRPDNLSPGRYGLLMVRDKGIGIGEDVQKLVFEPFFTTKKRRQGAGLGLSAVRSIVSAAGGGLKIQSVPGEGTSVYVYLPLWRRGTSPIPVKKSDFKPAKVARILVVDDEPVALKFMAGALERTGYTVVVANNGQEALELLEKADEPVDLLVTDIVMAPVNGPELVGQLAVNYPDLPVVYVSGFPGDWLSLQGSLSEEEIFLEKPFDSATLRRVVGTMLARASTD